MDVLLRVLPSISKFWPDCPYPIFVGLNSNHFVAQNVTTLVARPTEWRHECLEHIGQISATHLIVLLDDFLFQKPVEQDRLAGVLDHALKSNIPYLRLVPLGKSVLARLFNSAAGRSDLGIHPITEARPFYSGLQISLWDKAHFRSLLEKRGSIWDFEHHRMSGVTHYAINGRAPISYSHLVHKGRWLPYARTLLRRAGLSTDLGARPVWPKWMNALLAFDKARLLVFGYAIN
jgi:hypothetical protein